MSTESYGLLHLEKCRFLWNFDQWRRITRSKQKPQGRPKEQTRRSRVLTIIPTNVTQLSDRSAGVPSTVLIVGMPGTSSQSFLLPCPVSWPKLAWFLHLFDVCCSKLSATGVREYKDRHASYLLHRCLPCQCEGATPESCLCTNLFDKVNDHNAKFTKKKILLLTRGF